MRFRCVAGLVLLSVCGAQAAEQAPNKSAKPPPPDLDFLEYLGTLEGDAENWTDVVNLELPKDAPPSAKSGAAKTAKDKSKPETAAKGAGTQK